MFRTLLLCLGLCISAMLATDYAYAQCAAYTSASGATTFCQGGPGPTLSTSWYAAAACTATGYQWQSKASGTWSNIIGATGSTYIPTAAGYYRAQISTTASSTINADSISITVNPLPVATMSPSGAISACAGSPTILCTTAPPSCSYQWYLNSAVVGGATSACFTSAIGGTYFCRVTSSVTGCSGTSAAATISINPVPSAPLVSPLTYCQYATAVPLTATGSNLLWSSSSTGSSATATAPTPNTSTTGSTNYWVSQTVSSCQSAFVSLSVLVHPTPATPAASANTPVCIGDTLALTATSTASGPIFSWTGPNGFNSTLQNPIIANTTAAAAGLYHLRTLFASSGCLSAPDSVLVVISCLDSVWAGDANYDKTVDNTDALEIALTMGNTGAARAASSIAWLPAHCADWATMLPSFSSINGKHADCDGDGTVTINDTLAVTANYGLTHPKGVHVAAKKTAGLPDLYFDLSGIIPSPGATITVPIKMGNAATPVANMAGIAARIIIDGVTPAAQPSLSYAGSWLGSGNMLHFSKALSNNRADWAFARTDHHNSSGSGTLAWLTLTLPAGTQGQQLRLYFEDVTVVDSSGTRTTQFNTVDDSIAIVATGIAPNTPGRLGLAVAPNPSSGTCTAQLSLPAAGSYTIELRDVTGKLIWQSSGKGVAGLQSIPLPGATLSAGVYLVSLRSAGFAPAAPVRWIRE